MERFRDKVVLVVNTASHDPEAMRNFKVCWAGVSVSSARMPVTAAGFPRLAAQELQMLHDRYHGAGLEILAFPCNQVG